jgi:prevent-host-death family protein
MTMFRVNIHEAKAHFSDCVRRARQGERVVVCQRNVPIAEIVPFREEMPEAKLHVGFLDAAGMNNPPESFAPASEDEMLEWDAPLLSETTPTG